MFGGFFLVWVEARSQAILIHWGDSLRLIASVAGILGVSFPPFFLPFFQER